MFDGFFDKLFGMRKSVAPSPGGSFLQRARSLAWAWGHAETDVEHLLRAFIDVVDVKLAFERRGVVGADVVAILDQLFEERPRSEELGPKPELAARLQKVCERAVVGERVELGPLLENLAAALPRELAFFRPALTAAAPEIATFFSASLSHTADGQLTFAAWSPEMRAIVSLMQRTADEKIKTWGIGLYHLFFALLGNKKLHAAFDARGVDTVAILSEATKALHAKYGDERLFRPPVDFVPSITPGLWATFIRAERYAAEDRTSVTLRHVLAAVHDEPDFAPFVARLVR